MKNQNLKRLLSLVLAFCLCFGMVVPTHATAAPGETSVRLEEIEDAPLHWKPVLTEEAKADTAVTEQPTHAADEMVRVSIVMARASAVEAGFATTRFAENTTAVNYRRALKAQQDAMANTISKKILGGETLDVVWNLTLAANVISANVPYGKIDAIAALPGVERVVPEMQFEVTEADRSAEVNMATSGSMIGSSVAYNAGLYGAGTRIAVIDTGLDWDHQAFDSRAFDYAIAEYEDEVELMTKDEIAQVVDQLNLTSKFLVDGLTADALYWNTKVPFGFNYIDLDDDITHDNDQQGAHGSHVAGIASANRYLMDRSGKVSEALTASGCMGVAPDAQLLIMKVFGKYGSPYESDYIAAIEDAVVLGADSVNLSLGSGDPGDAHTDPVLQAALDSLADTDTVVTISASNSGSWSDFSNTGMTDARGYRLLYAEDVSLDTVGSPGSYENALTVASVENAGSVEEYMLLGDKHILFNETLIGEDGEPYTNAPLRSLVPEGEKEHTFEYVVIQGFGTDEDFAEVGDALKGKIAVCSRGEMFFYEKAENAVKYGAIATIIYNTEAGSLLLDLSDYTKSEPVVAINFQDGLAMVDAGTPVALPTEGHGYWTGEITIKSGVDISLEEQAYYDMSYFSSWGVPGDLSLKPEISAPGGNIYSVDGETPGGTSYVAMSGTSMAAPQMAGMAALMAEYYRENQPNTDLSNRQLAQSLLMSTAKPLITENGTYYSVMQQGAGLANVGCALNAQSYIVMGEDATKSWADGKVKVELGDDPDRTGSYGFSFTLNNMASTATVVELSADFFTQDWAEGYVDADRTVKGGYMQKTTTPLDCVTVFTVDGKLLTSNGVQDVCDFNGDGQENEADVQALLDYAVGKRTSISNLELSDLDGDGDTDSYDAYLLLANLEGVAQAVLPANGSVEVGVTMTLSDAQKADLEEKFSCGAYVEGYVFAETEDTVHSIPVLGFYGNWTDASMFEKGNLFTQWLGLEDHAPYIPENNLTNNINAYSPNEGSYWFSGFNFGVDPVNGERGAMNSVDSSFIRSIDFSAIRKSLASRVRVVNTETGEVYFEREMGPQPGAFFWVNGRQWYDYYNSITLNWRGTDQEGNPLPNNTPCVLEFSLAPEYYVDTTTMEADWDALGEGATLSWPLYIDNERPTVLDASISGTDLTLTIHDNYYVGGLMLVNSDGELVLGGEDDLITYDQTDANETHTVSISLDGLPDDVYTLQVVDYAMNYGSYRLFYNTAPVNKVQSVTVEPSSLQLVSGHSSYVSANVAPYNVSDTSVTWSTSDETVAVVNEEGLVTAMGEGACYITATSKLDASKSGSCLVTVISMNKTLNGPLCNYDGHTEWVEINVATLPEYTSMHEGDFMPQYGSAVKSPDGQIYAATLGYGIDGFTPTIFCKIDSETYEPDPISAISRDMAIFYADMTWAPHLFGGSIMAVWQDHLFLVDPDNGLYYAYQYEDGTLDGNGRHWKFCDDADFENLLGITYAGCLWSEDYQAYQDFFYLLASDGKISLLGIMQVGDNWYFSATRRRDCVILDTGLPAEETMFYDSIYYDGDMLYWAYYQNHDAQTTFYAITIDDEDPQIYELGTTLPDIWPMTGLYEENMEYDLWGTENLVANTGLYVMEPSTQEIVAEVQEAPVTRGSLQALGAAETREPENETVKVTVTAKNGKGTEISATNGVYTVTWDPAVLTLDSMELAGQFRSVKEAEGSVTFGFVNGIALAAGEPVAELYFVQTGAATVTVTEKELNNAHNVHEETVTLAYTNPCPSAQFSDVPENAWYHAAVDYVVGNGIMNGMGNGTFQPKGTMTRAQLAQVLYNLAGKPEVTAQNPFNDVKETFWGRDAIVWASANGIVNGVGGGKFDPNAYVTRETVVVMLYRYAKAEPVAKDYLSSCPDGAKVSSWAKEAMNWAVCNGFIKGDEKGQLNPRKTMTRAEVAQFMMNYLDR